MFKCDIFYILFEISFESSVMQLFDKTFMTVHDLKWYDVCTENSITMCQFHLNVAVAKIRISS